MALPNVSQPFGIATEWSGDTVVLRVTGELIAQHEAEVNEAVEQALATGAKHLLVDLRNVGFIDSLGVRSLIRSQLRSRAGDYSFAVIPGRGQVFRVVKTMGLDRVLHVLDESAAGLPASSR
jgi:anti-anti-sigma factor